VGSALFDAGWPDGGVGRDGGWMRCNCALFQGTSCGLHLLSAAHGIAGGTYEEWIQEFKIARSWMGMEACCWSASDREICSADMPCCKSPSSFCGLIGKVLSGSLPETSTSLTWLKRQILARGRQLSASCKNATTSVPPVHSTLLKLYRTR
jgi:hypothetical protein